GRGDDGGGRAACGRRGAARARCRGRGVAGRGGEDAGRGRRREEGLRGPRRDGGARRDRGARLPGGERRRARRGRDHLLGGDVGGAAQLRGEVVALVRQLGAAVGVVDGGELFLHGLERRPRLVDAAALQRDARGVERGADDGGRLDRPRLLREDDL